MTFKFSDSDLFNNIKNSSMSSEINKISLQRDEIPNEILMDNLRFIRRKINFPTKMSVYEHAAVDHDIVGVYNGDLKLPNFINFMVVKNKGKNIAVTIINDIYNDGEPYPKPFFGYLQNSLISLSLDNNFPRISSNAEFIRHSSIAYSHLMLKIFDKMFAINLEPSKGELLSFLFAKFYLLKMMQKSDGDNTDSVAYNSCSGMVALSEIIEIEDRLLEKDSKLYTSIFNLFKTISTLNGFQSLQIRTFTDNWVRMFGTSALLAIDYLPAFLQMIFSAQVNTHYNKEFLILDTADKEISRAYLAYARLLR